MCGDICVSDPGTHEVGTRYKKFKANLGYVRLFQNNKPECAWEAD